MGWESDSVKWGDRNTRPHHLCRSMYNVNPGLKGRKEAVQRQRVRWKVFFLPWTSSALGGCRLLHLTLQQIWELRHGSATWLFFISSSFSFLMPPSSWCPLINTHLFPSSHFILFLFTILFFSPTINFLGYGWPFKIQEPEFWSWVCLLLSQEELSTHSDPQSSPLWSMLTN